MICPRCNQKTSQLYGEKRNNHYEEACFKCTYPRKK